MDEISEYFVHKSIKKVQGKSSREEMKQAQIKIQENAAAVPSELGGGRHGCLGLTMSTTEHNNAENEVFAGHENLEHYQLSQMELHNIRLPMLRKNMRNN